MTRMISDANALMSGVTLSFTFEKMYIGKVLLPGPDTKLAITRSSSDSVKASSQPAIIAGAINGKVMSKTMRRGRQPRSQRILTARTAPKYFHSLKCAGKTPRR